MIGRIYPTTAIPTNLPSPPPVNFDTVNQEQASANRARPRPDAINFAGSTMMEPWGGSYLRPREKKTSWTLHEGTQKGKEDEGTWTGNGVAKSRVNLSSRELYARLSSYTEPFCRS